MLDKLLSLDPAAWNNLLPMLACLVLFSISVALLTFAYQNFKFHQRLARESEQRWQAMEDAHRRCDEELAKDRQRLLAQLEDATKRAASQKKEDKVVQ